MLFFMAIPCNSMGLEDVRRPVLDSLIVLVQSIMITGGSGFGFRVRGGWRT